MSKLFVRWTDDLQQAFERAVTQFGVIETAIHLRMDSRHLYDLRKGKSRAGGRKGPANKRKFISLSTVENLADLLDDPLISNVEALTESEWMRRGEWIQWTLVDVPTVDG